MRPRSALARDGHVSGVWPSHEGRGGLASAAPAPGEGDPPCVAPYGPYSPFAPSHAGSPRARPLRAPCGPSSGRRGCCSRRRRTAGTAPLAVEVGATSPQGMWSPPALSRTHAVPGGGVRPHPVVRRCSGHPAVALLTARRGRRAGCHVDHSHYARRVGPLSPLRKAGRSGAVVPSSLRSSRRRADGVNALRSTRSHGGWSVRRASECASARPHHRATLRRSQRARTGPRQPHRPH